MAMTTTATATRRQVTARAKALGVAVDYRLDREGVFHEIVLTAPDGYLFKGVGVHECVVASQVEHAPMATLYGPALDDMAGGLERCTDAQCDCCTERADDSADD
jgi:hypothetical protein